LDTQKRTFMLYMNFCFLKFRA